MKASHWVMICLVALAFLMGSFFYFFGAIFSLAGHAKPEKGNIAVIEVVNVIMQSRETLELIRDVRDDKDVKAVILRVDSPGGSVGASQEIFEAVKELTKVKPVVASMGTVAASGGYYVSAPATRILANSGTVTGSIGVLMEMVNVEELLKWAKVNAFTLKSGSLKDAGSSTRAMTPEEKAYFEHTLKVMHQLFKKDVADNRHLTTEEIDEIANGRVFTGSEALEKKLIDEIGGFDRAIQVAADLGKIVGKPEIYYPADENKDFLDSLMKGMSQSFFEHVFQALDSTIHFSYRLPS